MNNKELEKELKEKIRKAMGQINAIERMIDDNRPYEDLLIQIKSSKSILNTIAELVLKDYLLESLDDPDKDQELFNKRLSQIVKTFFTLQ